MCHVLMALQNRGVKIEEVHHYWSVTLEGITSPLQIELQLDILPAIIIEGQNYLKAGVSRLLKQTEKSKWWNYSAFQASEEAHGLSRVKQTWEGDIEEKMRHFYMTLSEKDRRRYAAVEALKLRLEGLCISPWFWAVPRNDLSWSVGNSISTEKSLYEPESGRQVEAANAMKCPS